MKEMKKLITAHLGKADEATAKQIAEALGLTAGLSAGFGDTGQGR